MANLDLKTAIDQDKDSSLLSLYEMCKVVGDQLTSRDVRVLKLMFNGIFTQEFLAQIHDGFSFLQALEKIDKVDGSNFRNVENYLRMINRHDLLQFLSLRRRKTVHPDPVTQYLEECATASNALVSDEKLEAVVDGTVRLTTDPPSTDDSEPTPSSSCAKRQQEITSDNSEGSNNSEGSKKQKLCTPSIPGEPVSNSPEGTCGRVSPCSVKSRRRSGRRSLETGPRRRSERLKRRSEELESCGGGTIAISATENRSQTCVDSIVNGSEEQQMKKKVTCDIRLRVRAEYANHQTALQGNIHSNKPEQIERQFEKFMQANTILKSRDLGSIICDIKFSELTYLDAFWRDYINGSLLEALKGVFITESLKQAVGHEAIKLLVNVDEDDYEAGRLMLLQSLKESQ